MGGAKVQVAREVSVYSNPSQTNWELVLDFHSGGDNPLMTLLWQDVCRIPEQAGLTEWQGIVFRLWMQGISRAEIGRLYPNVKTGKPRDRQTVNECLQMAFKKINRLDNLGSLAAIVQAKGWEFTRQYFAESRAVIQYLN
jgi:hypothetical protein